MIRKNYELAQENQDLAEEIDESVEIAKGKDVVFNELIRENWELVQENVEKDVVLDEVIRENCELAQEIDESVEIAQ